MPAPKLRDGATPEGLNALGVGHLPAWFGVEAVGLAPGRLSARMLIRPEMLGPDLPGPSIPALPCMGAGSALRMAAAYPGLRIVCFGHLGDGNLHYNLSRPLNGENDAFIARTEEVNRIVYDAVKARGGSISAEHGIGQLKRELLPDYKSAVEIDLMRRIKQAFDPRGLMNPGKVL